MGGAWPGGPLLSLGLNRLEMVENIRSINWQTRGGETLERQPCPTSHEGSEDDGTATKLETGFYSESCTKVTSDSVPFLIRGGLA